MGSAIGTIQRERDVGGKEKMGRKEWGEAEGVAWIFTWYFLMRWGIFMEFKGVWGWHGALDCRLGSSGSLFGVGERESDV